MDYFKGFLPFDFSEGVPYVSITKNGITFNKSVMLKLHHPKYVQLLINAETKQIALNPCDSSVEKAVPFYVEEKMSGKVLSVRWNGRDLLNTVSGLMKWDLDIQSFRVEGELVAEGHAMLFDLNKGTEVK